MATIVRVEVTLPDKVIALFVLMPLVRVVSCVRAGENVPRFLQNTVCFFAWRSKKYMYAF